ncbi:MAG: hypothetical protein AB7E72_01290 [Lysobacterales bacterium]
MRPLTQLNLARRGTRASLVWLSSIALSLWTALPLQAEELPAAAEASVSQRLEQSMSGYAESAIELLAASKSPRERWIAGLMLVGSAMNNGQDADQSEAMLARGQALLTQALADGKDDATLVFWAILDPPTVDRSNADAVARERIAMTAHLQQLEPDNAVVWLGALPPRGEPGAIPVAAELLAKAAAAKRFDTHFASSMQMLLKAFGRVPLPKDWPDTSSLPAYDGVSREDLPVIMAVGIASAMAMPYLVATQWWCGGNADEHPWLDDCRKLATTMVEHSDSIVPRSLGLALQEQLHRPGTESAERTRTQRRELAWLVERGLQRVGPGQPVSFAQWRQFWTRPGANEISVARALVKAQNLPATPPDDFVPAWDREGEGSSP